ncbi:MAG: ATP-binding protein [Thermodesulfobacteriota bacterium]|nr:ATP-binding protein [Thermodesulfobacteriota bacterium]
MRCPDIFKTSETPTSISITFNSTMKNLDRACKKTIEFLKGKNGRIKKDIFSIHLVLREGLTNAVKHGNENNPEKLVMCCIHLTPDQTLQMEIEDQGMGFDWQNSADVFPDTSSEGGRGLFIMKHYVSDYGYNETGNRLFLKKEISC